MEFQIALALEWLQAQSTKERTPEKLRSIVEHGCAAYAITGDLVEDIFEQARLRAQQRGLLAP
jgi:hypothetical protein